MVGRSLKFELLLTPSPKKRRNMRRRFWHHAQRIESLDRVIPVQNVVHVHGFTYARDLCNKREIGPETRVIPDFG